MHISTEQNDASRVDILLEEIAASDDAGERAALLLDLSEHFEQVLGDPEHALSCARAALDEAPERSVAAGRVADLLERLGQFSDLADFLSDRLDGARASRDGRAVMARRLAEVAERRLSDPALAIRGWKAVLSERPADREALGQLARLLGAAGMLRERLEVLAQLVDATESMSERGALHRELADGHHDLGQIERAAEHLEWALAEGTAAADDYQALARTYLVLGRVHAAIDAQRRRAELLSGRERAEVYLEVAALYEGERRDPGRAIDSCLAAEEACPGHRGALRTLLRLFEQRGDHESAAAALERWAAGPDCTTRAEKADLLARAGEIARRELGDADEAERLYRAALAADGAAVAALRGLVVLARERGENEEAAHLVMDALAACDADDERAELAVEAGELCEALGDRDGAAAFYRDALEVAPQERRAANRLAELLWQDGRHSELVGVLELLVQAPEVGDQLLTYQERLARAYSSLGLDRRALAAVRRARQLAPDKRPLCQLDADLSFRRKMWREASAALEQLLADPPAVTAERLELYYRAGVAAARTASPDRALALLGQALALDPAHRDSLVELYELCGADPRLKLDVLKALTAQAGGSKERCELLVEIGDLLCEQLDRPGQALATYQEALALAPDDHILIHKCLDRLAAEERWDECLVLFERLIESESSAEVRAKAAHAAALLCRDELGKTDEAMRLLWTALDDDPGLTPAREALEDILRARGAWQALANLYLKLLAHRGRGAAGEVAGPGDERVRLWSDLAELCWTRLGQVDDAIEALEVAHRLAPDDFDRLRELAERAAEAGPAHSARAIACHQELLARNKQRADSYAALESLYREVGLAERAEACERAYAFTAMEGAAEGRVPDRSPLSIGARALTGEMWTALAHPAEDPMVSALFARLAPLVAATAALSRKRLVLELGGAQPLPDDSVAGRVLAKVAGGLGGGKPEALACPDARTPVEIRLVVDRGAMRPLLVLGGPLLSGASERTIAFHLARALATLRGGGILRTQLARPEQLAHLLEAAIEMARGAGDRPAVAIPAGLQPTIRSLERGLSAPEREQLCALGSRLDRRALLPEAAARDWLRAHDLSVARVGLLAAGDLATAIEVLRSDPPSAGHHALVTRCQELIWSSATEPVLEARAHLDGWNLSSPPLDPEHPEPAVSVG